MDLVSSKALLYLTGNVDKSAPGGYVEPQLLMVTPQPSPPWWIGSKQVHLRVRHGRQKGQQSPANGSRSEGLVRQGHALTWRTEARLRSALKRRKTIGVLGLSRLYYCRSGVPPDETEMGPAGFGKRPFRRPLIQGHRKEEP